MLTLETPAWAVILRTTAVYIALLIGLRLAGKREIGQMTVFDLVVLLLLANAVQNAMVGPDTSLTGGILAAGALLLINGLVAQLQLRWPRLRRVIEGTPTLLVLHGELLPRHLQREGLDLETLQAALREHGLTDIRQAEMAVLEVDGSISVIPVTDSPRRMRPPRKFLRNL